MNPLQSRSLQFVPATLHAGRTLRRTPRGIDRDLRPRSRCCGDRASRRLICVRPPPRASPHQHDRSARQDRRHHGRQRLWQDDDPAAHRRTAQARIRQGDRRRAVGARSQGRRTVRIAPPLRHAVPIRGAVHRHERIREHRLSDARAHRPFRGAHSGSRTHEAARGGTARRRDADADGIVGRHGAPGCAGARDCARSHARDVRRALCGARPDLAGRRRPAHPGAQ